MTDRVIRIVVDSTGVVRGVSQAKKPLDDLDRKTKKTTKGLSTGFKAAAAGVVAFAAALGAREIFQAVDAFQGLQNRLRIVTDSTEELASVQKSLFEISQDTRTGFEAIASLYGSAAIAADELGASTEQLLRLTEISGKALAIQGSSAQESRGALRQLSQSFSSGIVRAEEFNSILEGAFPIAQAAARGFGEAGISVGELRKRVTEGQVSSTEFFDAIIKGGEGIDEQFEKTEVTLGQAITTIQNSFLNLVGSLNATSGAGEGLAGILIGVSDAIDDLTLAFTGTLQPEDELTEGMKQLATAAVSVGFVMSALADSLVTTVQTAFQIVGETIGATAAGLVAFFKLDFAAADQIFTELGESNAKSFQEGFGGLEERLTEDTQKAINKLEEIWDEGSRDIIAAATGGGGGGERPILPPNSAEDLRDAREAAQEFKVGLNIATEELRLTQEHGENAAKAIREFREDLELATAAADIFGELAPTEEVLALTDAFVKFGEEAIAAQRALREEIEAAELAATFDEQIEALEEEIMLLGASNEILAINAEVRALAAGATVEQAERIRELTEALLDQKGELDKSTDVLQDFFDDSADAAQSTLGGILADPMAEGLDELPFQFAQTLQKLAADALASELFDILGSLGGGGGGGGIGAFIGGLFGGGAQAGGQVSGGQPVLVGERGPELFTPPGSGAITPNVNINQAAQAAPSVVINNVTDPADIPAGLRTAEGEEEVINIIQRNPDAVRKLLG